MIGADAGGSCRGIAGYFFCETKSRHATRKCAKNYSIDTGTGSVSQEGHHKEGQFPFK